MVAAAIELKRLGWRRSRCSSAKSHARAVLFRNCSRCIPPPIFLLPEKKTSPRTTACVYSADCNREWDAVIVTHSSFEKIPVSLNTRRNFIAAQIDEIETAIREERADRGTRLVKELERVKKRLTAKLERSSADGKKTTR